MEKNKITAPIIFDYADPSVFLRDLLAYKQKLNPAFSARAWAQMMGFRNHSLLSLLLNGKRPILARHLPAIFRGLQLGERERKYFQIVVNYCNADTEVEAKLLEKKLRKHNGHNRGHILDVESFQVVANWVHFALLEMTALADFQEDPKWIRRRLRTKVSEVEIKTMLSRLERLGLLGRDAQGKLVKTNKRLTAGGERASRAVREYHRTMLEFAATSIETQGLHERILTSFALTIKPNSLGRFLELVEEFRHKVEDEIEGESGVETYQCNIQFFALTKGEIQNVKST